MLEKFSLKPSLPKSKLKQAKLRNSPNQPTTLAPLEKQPNPSTDPRAHYLASIDTTPWTSLASTPPASGKKSLRPASRRWILRAGKVQNQRWRVPMKLEPLRPLLYLPNPTASHMVGRIALHRDGVQEVTHGMLVTTIRSLHRPPRVVMAIITGIWV
jgi:hypothetical protein